MKTAEIEDATKDLDSLLSDVVASMKAALPAMLRERSAILAKLGALNEKIQASEQMVRAFGDTTITQDNVPASVVANANRRDTTSKEGRQPVNQVYEHVAKVMADGKRRGFGELHKLLRETFSIDYAASSLHRALSKGREDGRYGNDNREWFLRGKK